jgi:predicted benzoate:H+ symporter BenE
MARICGGTPRRRPSWPAGFIAVAISCAGLLLVTLEAAIAAELSPQLAASWMWAISVGSGVVCLIFSWVTRQPVMVRRTYIAGSCRGGISLLVAMAAVTAAMLS